MLQGYENVLPGSAERILKMAERQQEHRQSMEKIVIEGDSKRSDKGLYCGAIIAAVGLIGATVLGINGQAILAGVIGGAPLVGLVGIFVTGTITRRAEREQKADKMNPNLPQ
ncbi:MAG: DUF2335 domain-containing protein [Chloroflexi bacterium]|nr:DUF2335 domain-containing protein [Chloroflexota bacterium]MBI4187557.1 DUF2335 domain-containing protein [Chloroflexota bacterium]